MKRRVIVSLTVQLGFTVLSLLVAYNLDCLASGQSAACSWNPADAAMALENRRVLIFFLLFTALSGLAVFCMAFGRSYINYRSDMLQLTPNLEIPVAAGQGQYGTAHWLEARKIPTVFTVVVLDKNDPLIHRLIQDGAKDSEGKPHISN